MSAWRRLPLAWLQLIHDRTRFLVAIVGVAFAAILMFMQLGFEAALYDSAGLMQRNLRGELIVIERHTETISAPRSFSRRQLQRVLGHADVQSAMLVYLGYANWKNPWDGSNRAIFAIGFEPTQAPFSFRGLDEGLGQLVRQDAMLFDRASRAEFGPVAEHLNAHDALSVEVNRRRVEVAGLFEMGASFAANANVVMGDINFMRLFPERAAGAIDLGVVRLRPGADVTAVQRDLRALLGSEQRVVTPDEFFEMEEAYWAKETAIGMIFRTGVVLGWLVGMIIVAQILYADVSRHLPEYATLKAMGHSNAYLTKTVLHAALILSVCGFVPGALAAWVLYDVTGAAAFLPLAMDAARAMLVFALTLIMCFAAGYFAMRKLREADPASVF